MVIAHKNLALVDKDPVKVHVDLLFGTSPSVDRGPQRTGLVVQRKNSKHGKAGTIICCSHCQKSTGVGRTTGFTSSVACITFKMDPQDQEGRANYSHGPQYLSASAFALRHFMFSKYVVKINEKIEICGQDQRCPGRDRGSDLRRMDKALVY